MTNKNTAMRFAARVAIITGAARGLGREYALLLASRGARVVVNDLGGSRDGSGKSAAADAVVQEIINLGGEAVADYNSVEEGDKIVKTAIDHFGRVDILINNAGILRDKSMMKITDEDWDLVHRVHLRGSFLLTRAAWPYFRKQNFGRIVMTSSPSGIYGNFGQANYSSAKLGMLSLAKTLAVEGEKYNIKCNTILPVAASRLTEDLLPEDIFEMFKPQYVAPMVAFLSHEECPVNGEVFEAAGGFFGRYQWKRSKGKVFVHPEDITIENIRDSWNEISDTSKYTSPISMQDHTMQLISQLKGIDVNLEGQKNPELNSEGEQGKEGQVLFTYNPTDVILYALSIGVSTNESGHLRYLYENDELFSVFPTFGATLSVNALYETSLLYDVISKYKLEDNLIKTLHGEQYLKIYQPIPTSGKLYSKPNIVDVLDKGSGALILVEVPTYDAKGNLIFKNQLSLFMVGSGNFGGKRSSDSSVMVQCIDPPNRPPDAIVHQSTTIDQAALFRLCGDKNPLHIDPNFSLIGGFDKPILHGLCMLGFAVRHALRQFANYEGNLLDAVKARFVGTVIPGQTIETRLWRSPNADLVRIHFECFVRETGSKIISGAFVDLKQSPGSTVLLSNSDHSTGHTVLLTDSVPRVLVNPHSNSSHQAEETSSNNHPQPSTMTDQCQIDRIFEGFLRNKVKEHPEIVQLIKTIYQFNITKEGKLHTTWTLDLKNGKGDIYRGVIPDGKPDCTLIVEDDVITKIFEGKDDALQAFMGGRLKVTGNIMAAQKLQQIWSENSAQEQLSESDPGRTSSRNLSSEDKALIESIPVSGLKCDLIFNILQTRMHEEPDLVKKLTASYQFNITSNGKFATTWTAENKTDPKGIAYNQPYRAGKPDCLVTVEDDDFVRLMFGKLNPQRAFMLGKLKVKGNIMLLQRLNSIWLELQKSGKAPELPYIVELIDKTDLMPGVRSEMMIVELIQRLIRLPYLCREVPTLVGFEIMKDGKTVAEYTLDFTKNKETGTFDRGLPQGDQYCVLTFEDDDFVLLTYHKLTLEEAIKMGRVKVKGDQNIPSKISIVFKTPTSRVRL